MDVSGVYKLERFFISFPLCLQFSSPRKNFYSSLLFLWFGHLYRIEDLPSSLFNFVALPYYITLGGNIQLHASLLMYEKVLQEAIICNANCRRRKLHKTAVISKLTNGFAWFLYQSTCLPKPFLLMGLQVRFESEFNNLWKFWLFWFLVACTRL